MYVGFIDLKKVHDTVNREALWRVLRMYDVRGKLLSGIKNMHINKLPCVKVKGGESEQFKLDSVVRQGCITSPWLFNIYTDGVMKEGSEL